MELPEPAHPLFELPPEEFTAERDRIARELKRSGDPEAAAVVNGLKRPTVTAYALNLVARHLGETIEALLDAGDRLGSATSRTAMEEAKADRQRAIGAVVSGAAALLADRGRPITAQVRERITETLLAAATDDETRERLRSGQLLKEAEAAGFGGPVAAFEAVAGDGEKDRLAGRVEKLRGEADAKFSEARKARADAERALREHRELSEAAEAAKARAGKLSNLARKAEELAEEKLAEAARIE